MKYLFCLVLFISCTTREVIPEYQNLNNNSSGKLHYYNNILVEINMKKEDIFEKIRQLSQTNSYQGNSNSSIESCARIAVEEYSKELSILTNQEQEIHKKIQEILNERTN